MQDSTNTQRSFSPGDIVYHRSRNTVGRVSRVTADPDARLFIRSKDGDEYDMTVAIAGSALSKLPNNGLESCVINARESLINWEKEAPLKLVALALLDLGMAGKPGKIRIKLESNQLISTKWESWWKKVQPAAKQSRHFRVRHDGAYELVTSPDQVPEAPLTSTAKKKEGSLPKSQLVELLKKVEAGETNFEDIEGARAKHRVARELVKRARKERQVNEIIVAALRGPARPAGIMLEELVKKGEPQDIGRTLIEFLTHIIELASNIETTRDTGTTEHLTAKLNLFSEDLAKALSLWDVIKLQLIPGITTELIKLGVHFSETDTTTWRTKVKDSILHSLRSITTSEPALAAVIGSTIAALPGTFDSRLAVASGLARILPAEASGSLIRSLVKGTAEVSVDFADRLVMELEPRSHYVRWWIDNLKEVMPNRSEESTSHVQTLLEKIGVRTTSEELSDYLQLVFLAPLLSPATVLPGIAVEKLSEWASSIKLPKTHERHLADESALSPVQIAIEARLKQEKNEWDKTQNALQSTILHLQTEVGERGQTVARLEDVTNELKTGFRTPEKWIEYRAKRDVLQRLGMLHQEISTASEKEPDNASLRWARHEVELILVRNGAELFSEAENVVVFDPSKHGFIRGQETSDREVKVRYPGFLLKDPAGDLSILVVARVTRK